MALMIEERDLETVLNALLIAAGVLAQDIGTLHHSPAIQAAARQGREVFEDLAARLVLYRKLQSAAPPGGPLSDTLVEMLASEWEQIATSPRFCECRSDSHGVAPSMLRPAQYARRCALTGQALRELLASRVLVRWVAREGCTGEITALARAMTGT